MQNFAFIVADTMSDIVTKENNKSLLNMEDLYLQRLLPEYNIAQKAGNTFGVLHTEATKLKMRINYSSERRQQIGSLNRGKKLSDSTIKKMQRSALSRKPLLAESRAKISKNSAKANLYRVSHVDKILLSNGNYDITLQTISKVAKFCKCSSKTVQRALGSSNTGIIKKT